MTVKKLYRCPVCGDTLTDAEYEGQLEAGYQGYCYCQYKDGERIFTGYDVYIIQPYRAPSEALKVEQETEK